MKQLISSEWKGGLVFEADLNGHKLVTDAPPESGGQDSGPTPKILLLASLAGCTGIDIVSILKKMRVNVEACNISIDADVREEHPKYYDKIHIVYEFTGKDLPMDKLEKAVTMSENTYCSVGAMLRKSAEITSEIRINRADNALQ